MKKLLLALLLVMVMTTMAYAYRFCNTDWRCVNDCIDQGYQWGYCKKICSWCD